MTKQFLLPNNLWRTGGLFLVAFWAVFYFNGDFLHHGWFNDDRDFVRELRSFNSHGRYPQINGDPGLREVLSTWNPRHGWLYRPVFLTYLAGMFKLFGANPLALHAGNLVLHSITLVLLFVLVFRLSKSLVAGLLAALLFVYWPQHSEAIWWISCGSTLLAGLFSLATLLLWSLFREHSSRKYFAGTLACFVLALCSKEDAMSLPLILLALDWFLAPQSTFRARVRLLWPFALVYAIYLACAWVGYSTYVQIQPWARLLDTRSTGSRPEVLQSFLSRLFTNPVPMSRDWFWLPLGLSCVWAGWEWRRGQRWPLFGLLWLILAALPVPLASGNHVYAPRFFYTPMLGLATVCASMCLSLWQQPVTRPLGVALGLTFLAGLLPRFSVDVTAGLTLGLLLAGYVLWRCQKLSTSLVVTPALVLAIGQGYVMSGGEHEWPYQLATMLLVGVLTATQRDYGAALVHGLAAGLLWANPVVMVPIYVAGLQFRMQLRSSIRPAREAPQPLKRHGV